VPELPEVETIVRQLQKGIRGKTITAFSSDTPKMLIGYSLKKFQQTIQNRKIIKVKRKGKIILLELSGGLILAVHLRLTGQLFIRKPSDLPDKYNHAKFSLGKLCQLRFNDLRKFGQIWLLPKKELKKDFGKIQKLGPDPLEPKFTFQKFKKILKGKTAKIKTLLLDQAKISGIGNIYSDEALFLAKIHPETPADKIPPAKLQSLYRAIKKVLREAIKHHGTSDMWYREAYGKKGKHQLHLRVYHRTGSPCKKCKATIKRIKINNRSTHFCPRCQKAVQS